MGADLGIIGYLGVSAFLLCFLFVCIIALYYAHHRRVLLREQHEHRVTLQATVLVISAPFGVTPDEVHLYPPASLYPMHHSNNENNNNNNNNNNNTDADDSHSQQHHHNQNGDIRVMLPDGASQASEGRIVGNESDMFLNRRASAVYGSGAEYLHRDDGDANTSIVFINDDDDEKTE